MSAQTPDVIDTGLRTHPQPPLFPGRVVTGVCLTVAPVVLAAMCFLGTGIYHFTGHAFLAAMAAHTVRTEIFLNVAPLAIIMLMLALVGVATMAATRAPRLARIGGSAVLIGLCGPLYFMAVEFSGYQLADPRHRAAGSYMYDQANMIPRISMNIVPIAIVGGFIVLAVAAHRAGLLGRTRAVCLALTALLPVGFIAAVLPISGVGFIACTVALAPLGVALLRPSRAR